MPGEKSSVVIMLLLCGFCASKSEIILPEDFPHEMTCFQDTDCRLGDYCYKYPGQELESGVCQSCGPLMTFNYEEKRCLYCPIFREKCYNNCCYSIDGYSGYEIRCVEGMCQRCHKSDTDLRNCNLHSYQDITAKFIVAFAIAFSVALTSIIIYRWSFRGRRQRMLSERRFSLHSETIFSPVQERTQELLQDRPPMYQTRHNYRHQQDMKAKTQVATVACQAPPPYPGMEAGGDTATDAQPPPYSRTESSSEKTLHI